MNSKQHVDCPHLICEVHDDTGYNCIIYPVIDWSECDWSVNGNVLDFEVPQGSESFVALAMHGSIQIEEIYIGELYTSVIATTTERIEFWFSNELEKKQWEYE